jgi:DNA-binding beta-propeller fold protein YncE
MSAHFFLPTLFLLTSLSVAQSFFEARQQSPIALTPDATKLLALHSTAHSLSVFDIGSPPRATPLLIAEIPVSTAPVSVRPRTNDEVWVVNEVSDSISVISLSRQIIIDTLRVPDEPADVIFAAGKAFVSCSRSARIAVFDAVSRTSLGEIPLRGVMPRALATNADGTRLYVASLLSGNRTTILAQELAPLQPAPTNAALPAPPRVSLIVPANDPRVTWNVLDNDIAEINTTSQTVTRWISGVGTHLFDLAIHPDGSLWCANSESLNLTRFEPELNGHFMLHRLSRIPLSTGTIIHHDLNPTIPRRTTPDATLIPLGIAQPTSVRFNASGSRAWVAAFNSDLIAEIDPSTGSIVRRIDLRASALPTEPMRGPRALALTAHRLYSLNKLSDTLSTIDPATGALLSETPIGSTNPIPAHIRRGRSVLYDARLSGNGTMSCASCHLDSDRDGLAWDLGDPSGTMTSVASAELSIHDFTVLQTQLHPMKGPLLTQTLHGLATNDARPNDPTSGTPRPAAAITTKFHWRGDKPSIQSFNTTFPNLMGGNLQPTDDMNHLASYLMTIALHPNPNRNLDRTLRTNLPAGNASRGLTLFNDHLLSHCIVCHDFNAGTDQNIDFASNVNRFQPFKNPPLRLIYQRDGIFNPTPGAESLAGFGLAADGSGHLLPIVHPYDLDLLDKPPLNNTKRTNLADLKAFILSFDTNTAPVVGHDLTTTLANRTSADLLTRITLLETQAALGWNGLIVWGRANGETLRLRWDTATSRYIDATRSLTRTALLNLLTTNDALTFSGVPLSETRRRSDDRNGNGIADSLQPPPQPFLLPAHPKLRLQWNNAEWYPESVTTLTGPWQPAPGEPHLGNPQTLEIDPAHAPTRFFRMRRNW